MNFLKCAGIIDNDYFYASENRFVFPNRTDPAFKNVAKPQLKGITFDLGCVYDGYNSTYILGTDSKYKVYAFRVPPLNNNTITPSPDSRITFTETPDLKHEVLFITKANDPCVLYASNDTANTILEDCMSGEFGNITQDSNITSLSNYIAHPNTSFLYEFTNSNVSLYNASSTNFTLKRTFQLNNQTALTQASAWKSTVAGYSTSFEFALSSGNIVQKVTIYDVQSDTSATVVPINSAGLQQDSLLVFSNNPNSTLYSVSENGVNELLPLGQNLVSTASISSSSGPTSTPTPTEPSPLKVHQNEALSKSAIIGISVGVSVFALILIALCVWCLFFRRKRNSGRSIDTTSTGPINRENDFIGKRDIGPTKPEIISSTQEGDPDFTGSSTIFNKSCFISTDEIGDELSMGGIFLRKCEFKASRKKRLAMIHYFTSERKEQFGRSLLVLKSLSGQSDRILQFYKAFELETPSPTHQIKYILITSRYEPKNNLRVLYAKEGELHNYINLSDDVFKVWMVYSILTAVQALHNKNITHNRISLKSFYAETNAPTMDWTLGDFYHATTDTSNLDDKTDARANDILGVGRMIYNIVFEQVYPEHDTIQFDSSKIKGAYKEQFTYLLEHTLFADRSRPTSADELLRYWKKHFKF